MVQNSTMILSYLVFLEPSRIFHENTLTQQHGGIMIFLGGFSDLPSSSQGTVDEKIKRALDSAKTKYSATNERGPNASTFQGEDLECLTCNLLSMFLGPCGTWGLLKYVISMLKLPMNCLIKSSNNLHT